MRRSASLWVSAALLVGAAWCAAAGEPAIKVEPLHDKAIRVGVGEVYDDSIVALASQRGLVVIDSGVAHSLTRRYREKIQEHFGRKDFAFVINTHFHFDHTDGNQVFRDATIVGHELVPERMRDFDRTRAQFVAARRARIEAMRGQLAGLDPGSEAATRLKDLIATNVIMCDDLEGDFLLTPPSVTFSERMALDLGDMTVKLYAFGPGTHTGDDVVVHVPELDLVAMGDLWFPRAARFAWRIDQGIDIPRKLDVLDAVLADEGLRHVVTVHNGVGTREALAIWRDYMRDVWTAISEVEAAGGTLADVRARLDLESGMAYLTKLGGALDDLRAQHRDGVAMAWLATIGGENAAQTVSATLEAEGVEVAWATFRRLLAQRDDRALVDEQGFNGLGYRLLQAGRTEQAIAVFQMNVEAFPASWNVYDSLGEGFMEAGETERAIANYRKSIELNPDNDNGRAMLERLGAPEGQPER